MTVAPATPPSKPKTKGSTETRTVVHEHRHAESWMAKTWRPLCGVVYLMICVTDFVIMPIAYEVQTFQYTPEKIMELALKVEGGVHQVETIRVLREHKSWKPITMAEGGFIHLAFGTILGAAAWTRGMEKVRRAEKATRVE